MATAISAIDRIKVRQEISRRWLPHLTGSQFAVVDMIFDRTLAWGRVFCSISIPEFVRGSHKGYTSGTGLGERTVYRALAELTRLGVIIKQGLPGRRSSYALNLEWAAMSLPPQKKAPVRGLQEPKRKQEKPAPAPAKTAMNRGVTPAKTAGHSKGSNTGKGGEDAGRHSNRETNAERIRLKLDKETQARLARAAEKEAARLSRMGLVKRMRTLWLNKMREHWPDDPALAWSPKARGLWKHAERNKAFADVSPDELVSWVIENWGLLRNLTFKWMGDPPAVPDPEFVAVHLYRILSAYATRDTLKRELQLTGTDRIRAKHRRGGMTEADAENAASAEEKMQTMVSREEHDALKARLAREQEARRRMDEQLRANANRIAKPNLGDFDRE